MATKDMVIKGNYETVLEGFEQKLKRARFFGENQYYTDSPLNALFDIMDRKVHLKIVFILCREGKLAIRIWRDSSQSQGFHVRLRGKIQLVETNASATLEAVQLRKEDCILPSGNLV